MNKHSIFEGNLELLEFYKKFKSIYNKLGVAFLSEFNRLPALSDLIVDRWEKGKLLGFGENTNIYDNSLVIGDVSVGKEVWIGPNTILDGSGKLIIGDFCTISAGVQIYTHDNVAQTLSSKKKAIERMQTTIGSNVYIAPNAVLTKGIVIGDFVLIGVGALVNKDVEPYSIVFGQPARKVGTITIDEAGEIKYEYFNK